MTEAEALYAQQEIKNFCQELGAWCDVVHEFRPVLKTIKVVVSIKVEEQGKARTK